MLSLMRRPARIISGMEVDRLRLVREVVGVHPDAVAADQPGR